MREIKRHIERPKLALRRTADGRLRPASEEADIADIWAEQKRIRLQQAIEEDKRRALKKQRRREGKLFGRGVPKTRVTASADPSHAKEIEIRLSLPKLHMPSMDDFEDFLGRVQLPEIHWPNIRRKHVVFVACAVTLAVLGLAAQVVFGGGKARQHGAVAHGSSLGSAQTSVLGAEQRPAMPGYSTILPAGKTIAQLGGWGRVSPPGSDPVFAYADKLDNVAITVSEQPLPDSFSLDMRSQLAKVAKQFGVTKPLAVSGDAYAYVGPSGQGGSQAAVVSKQGLLILIRTAPQPIAEASIAAYIQSLQ